MHDLIDQGHTYAFLYFFTFMVLATFIMLNLVVAVILNNYEQMDQTEQSPIADRSEGANYEMPESEAAKGTHKAGVQPESQGRTQQGDAIKEKGP